MSKRNIIISFIIIYSVFCFIALNRHSSSKLFTYHSEIWADKAGYNIYLPALFIYHFDAARLPEHIESRTGYGFQTDSLSHKIITKYPYGVALMQSPFWLAAHILSPEKNGFSLYYQKAIDIAGSFYLTLGLLFLFLIVLRYKQLSQSILLSLCIILSSGIFYYGIFETGMSHIYSFCCLSIILYVIESGKENRTFKNLFVLILVSSLFIMIRPVNSLFLGLTLLFFWHNNTLDLKKIIRYTKPLQYLILLGTFMILLLPQLFYYNYAYESFFTNSYHQEPFLTPNLSRITELLFSPNNGLLVFYPVLILLLIYYFTQKNQFNKLSITTLILYIVLYASWWSLSLGCGFGHRAVNDVVVLLFIPVIYSPKPLPKYIWYFLLLFAVVNLKFIFSYDTCLHYSEDWNFNEYLSILFGQFK